ncbi:mucin-2-like [Lampetra planeri]
MLVVAGGVLATAWRSAPATARCANRARLPKVAMVAVATAVVTWQATAPVAAWQSTRVSAVVTVVVEVKGRCADGGRKLDAPPRRAPRERSFTTAAPPARRAAPTPAAPSAATRRVCRACFCPEGTVRDDHGDSHRCISQAVCPCKYEEQLHHAGDSLEDGFNACTCKGGQWLCDAREQQAECSLEGGSHVTSFDSAAFSFHSEGDFILCMKDKWMVHARLRQEEEEELPSLAAILFTSTSEKLEIDSEGKMFLNDLPLPLPYHSDSVKVYRPSSSFIHLQARLGLKVEVQVKPVMQVYLAPSAEHKGKLKGMCGNYNGQEADDFTSPQNIVEATGESFAASWNTAAAAAAVVVVPNLCRDKELSKRCDVSDHPIFKKCLKHVDFEPFKKNCEMDVCHSTSRSREKFCGALGSLARACGRRGVPVANWGSGVCEESCPAGQALGEAPSACSKTCHGFVEPAACDGDVPYSGCLCPEGQLLEPEGSCVPPEGCPCYAGNRVVPPGQSYESGSQRCVCKSGVLHCENPKQQQQEVCGKPQVYVNCSALPDGDLGKACERSCRSLSLPCVAVVCESGCTCAPGLVLDDGDFCVAPEDCPCLHNGRVYGKGESVNLDCNKCVCSGGAWSCTVQPCPGACKMYGDGHYVTFDGKRFVFDGKCDYGVVQDYCANQEGSFQIITDNEDCGTAGTTCSKSVRFFIKAYNVEVQMADGEVTVVPVGGDGVFPDVNSLSVHSVGLYRIVQAAIGVMVMWDRRTSIFVKLDSKYKGKVCGLCGNFNGDVRDDFTTRGGSSVASAIAFGNSWKSKESCSAVTDDAQPCASNHYRLAWAQRKCNILQSDIFQDCHSHVDRAPFFEACVRDSCACDSGGDCECFCTAVASYAQACNEAGICVKWRTPDRCPVFCDFFDQDEGDCTWHYSPCGNLPLTCKERAQAGAIPLPAMEGCFPHCPSESPYLDENTMRCVRKEECSCFFGDQEIPAGGEITLSETCQICTCENANLTCSEPAGCCYDGQLYDLGGVIANETDSVGVCTYLTLCTPGGHVDYNQYCIATSAPTSIILTTPMTRPVIFSTLEPPVKVTEVKPPENTPPPPPEVKTSPPSSGEKTPPPSSGEKTPPPSSGEKTPPPSSGEKTPPPSSGEKTPPPSSGEKTPPPSSGEKTPPPSSGEKTPSPSSGEKTPPPSSGEKTPPPSSGEKTPPPSSGEKTPPPSSGEKTPPPSSGEKTPSPSSGEKTPPPSSGEKTPPPSSGEKTPPPSSGEKTPPPSSGEKTPPPSSGEKTPPPSSGEKTPPPSSGEKTPPPKEETTKVSPTKPPHVKTTKNQPTDKPPKPTPHLPPPPPPPRTTKVSPTKPPPKLTTMASTTQSNDCNALSPPRKASP